MAYLNDIETGIKLIRALTDLLNTICKTEGGIGRDDNRIWGDYLHQMTNEEWDQIVKVLEALRDNEPGLLYPNDIDVLAQAREAINKAVATDKSYVGKPNVSKSGNKRNAWQTIMTMREVVNRHTGVHVPNRPKQDVESHAKRPSTTFQEIFQ
jgi:hypothetical protein